MAFPTTLDSFGTAIDGSTDVLAADINDVRRALEAAEAKVGVNSSAVSTSHDFKLSKYSSALYSADANGVVPDGTDQTSNFATLLTNVYALGGGTILFGRGTYRFDGAIRIPDDGGTLRPNSTSWKFIGAGSWGNGSTTTVDPIGGTIWDLRGAISPANIDTRGQGAVEFTGITFSRKNATAPGLFFQSTNTTPKIHHCCFYGRNSGISATPATSATWTASSNTLTKTGAFPSTVVAGDQVLIYSGTNVTPGVYTIATRVSANAVTLTSEITTDNSDPTNVTFLGVATDDAIAIGGTGTGGSPSYGTNGADDAFQGYGVVVDSNWFNFVQRCFYLRAFANGCVFTNNFAWNNCGGKCMIEIAGYDSANKSTGNLIAGNGNEMTQYQYFAKLSYAQSNAFFFNNLYDTTEATYYSGGYYYLGTGCANNTMVDGYHSDASVANAGHTISWSVGATLIASKTERRTNHEGNASYIPNPVTWGLNSPGDYQFANADGVGPLVRQTVDNRGFYPQAIVNSTTRKFAFWLRDETPTNVAVASFSKEGAGRWALRFESDASTSGDIISPHDLRLYSEGGSTKSIQIGAYANEKIQVGTGTGNKVAFFDGTPQSKPTVTGSRGGNAALASLLTALAAYGLIVDSSS